ncbi:anaphase-promoting complex subunit 8 [Cocos nucifera]|uniref:Anaphase-promoting complex subunit 8 n=1 Tax=Cocos nucifera TaxID=13894 RepID=A0A8K0INB7_COCNU|nr:anaphase-promoting complex subunit 8 [Cocos nucifera]
MTSNSKETYRCELRAAIHQLGDRCLYSAAKWAAELLVGIEADAPPSSSFSAASASASSRASPSTSSGTPSTSSASRLLPHNHRDGSSFRRLLSSGGAVTATPLAGVSYVSTPIPHDDGLDGCGAAAADCYLLAKSYFDCREYRRAAHALRGQTGRKHVFLRCYALYVFVHALNYCRNFFPLINGKHPHQDFGIAISSYPWNWSAWSEQSLCTTTDILDNLNLKNHWMKDFFLASAYQELKMHEEALKRYESLMGIFQFSDYIQAQIATAQYNLRELDEAEMNFEEILRNDPYRVDSMDVYSNLLYAKECFSALSFLTHKVFLTDKYRPESCCIIANYYSLKGQHEKSVLYFRRALKLNRKYLSAWTLMGHEYVEMKNTPAAIDAYRRAVDINPRDYRAWYGLGQTYEMMGMPSYALYYFQKSSYLQSNDARLWIAMAQCYESAPLQMLEEAIKCYTRAANSNDWEGIALHQLAKLHCILGHSEQAAFYYKKDLERMEAEEKKGPNMIEALLFLVRHYKDKKRFEEAEVYCTRLLDYTGPVSDLIFKDNSHKILFFMFFLQDFVHITKM